MQNARDGSDQLDPVPIEQTDDAELEKAIFNGLLFHQMSADVEEVKALGQIVHMVPFNEIQHEAAGVYERGILLTMADGSEFELILVRTKRAEYQFRDEML